MSYFILYTYNLVEAWSEGKIVPEGTYRDEEPEAENTHILPDKADFFLVYASMPGYRYSCKLRDKTFEISLKQYDIFVFIQSSVSHLLLMQ